MMGKRISSSIWAALMAVLAIGAVGAQADRAVRRQPALAPVVPPLFRNFAQWQLTMSSVRSSPPATAFAEAQTLIERSPIPSESFTFLSVALIRNNDQKAGGLAIQRAAQRGWRDPIAQRAMYDIALSAGDHAEAAHRLAALYGLQDSQVPLKPMTDNLLITPQGRAAMADSLVSGGYWTRAFMRGAVSGFSPDIATTVSTALRRGAEIDCRTAAALKKRYFDNGLAKDAPPFDRCRRRT
ncbi:hypothetical protein HGI47_00925 [Novosphingobium sp. ERN07]|uniref:hypothetical protein n=1 Tax=Novosphingobium sp. ERN07 TaxID=2726187 RepID=UPI001456890A|nr:hypothetical protein [Novosphingobium sp. ERN07]NLR69437.1 hypothetical protein [Novosphingobium sp. ERN07]